MTARCPLAWAGAASRWQANKPMTFATANTEKVLCSVGRMDAYAGCARRGTAARDNATLARRVKLWPAEDRHRRQGLARHGADGPGVATQARQGTAMRGAARRGAPRQRRLGAARQGRAGSGTARQRRRGWARRGMAWQGNAGKARPGEARCGRVRRGTTQTGERDRGINCAHFLVSKQQPTKGEHTWLAY